VGQSQPPVGKFAWKGDYRIARGEIEVKCGLDEGWPLIWGVFDP
jgi:hypothetical protein